MGWVYEADIKNFFGSLGHKMVLQFMQHRVSGPRRILSLIQRWLKAGVVEKGVLIPGEIGTPQGGSKTHPRLSTADMLRLRLEQFLETSNELNKNFLHHRLNRLTY